MFSVRQCFFISRKLPLICIDFLFSALKERNFELFVTIITQLEKEVLMSSFIKYMCLYYASSPLPWKITGTSEREEVQWAQFPKKGFHEGLGFWKVSLVFVNKSKIFMFYTVISHLKCYSSSLI